MMEGADRVTGQCRCGRTRFEVSGSPLITMACHCTGCQLMTASAFSLSSLHTDEAFRLVEGEPVIGGLRGGTCHYFCPSCLSWLFTRPEGLPGFVNLRSMMLDNAANYRPFVETWTSEMLPWATTGATHSYVGFPPAEQFQTLLDEFAQAR